MARSAVVIGASGGIGSALADELEAAEYAVHRMSRADLDLTDDASIEQAANRLRQAAIAPELVIVATGLLHRSGGGPEKSISDLDPAWMLENFRVNAIGPALIGKHFLPLMPRDRRICLAMLSARVGSISDNRLGGWHSYRASKAALNMLVRNLAIEWQRKNPDAVIVGLHPGTVETALSAPYKGNAATERLGPATAAKRLLAVLDGLDPAHSGQLIAYDGSLIAP